MNINLLKALDWSVGRFLIRILPYHEPVPLTQAGSFLIIRPGGIGDAVLLIPALKTLKAAFPQASIDILSEKRNSAVFALYPEINKVYHYDNPRELLTAMRGHYDVVIDTEQWHRLSAVVARSVKSPMSIGFATNERKKLYTHPVSYSHDDFEPRSFLNLCIPLVGEVTYDPDEPFLDVKADLSIRLASLFSSIAALKIVTLFPGGSIREKRWGHDRFHRTAQLLSEQGFGIVVIGGKDDREEGEIIIRGIANSLNLCAKLSLSDAAVVLKRSSLLITGDSGIMHIGYGLGIKLIALFGPGNEKKWAPRGKNCKIINKNMVCSPCTKYGYTPKCPKDTACMKGISTEDVISSAIALLDK